MKLEISAILARGPQVVCTELSDGGAVLLNLENNYFYMLNQEALVIWKCLDGKAGLSQVLKQILVEYDIDEQAAEAAVLEQAGQFVAEHLAKVVA